MDTVLYDQYVMERYKNGLTGKGSQTKTPEFKFEKPDFSKIPNINKVTLDYNSLNSNLNPRFQKILDTFQTPLLPCNLLLHKALKSEFKKQK
jgi:hypothetical protein